MSKYKFVSKYKFKDFVDAVKKMDEEKSSEEKYAHLREKENIADVFQDLFLPITTDQYAEVEDYTVTDDLCVTRDYVTIRGIPFTALDTDCLPVQATDFALMNGAMQIDGNVWEMLNDCGSNGEVSYYDDAGVYEERFDYIQAMGIRPCMRMNIDAFKSLLKNDMWRDYFDAGITQIGDVKYHTITFGEYPCDRMLAPIRNIETDIKVGAYKPSGRRFLGRQIVNSGEGLKGFPFLVAFTKCEEYCKSDDEDFLADPTKIVKVRKQRPGDCVSKDAVYLDKTKVCNGFDEEYVEVEPITWIIRNWEDLPKEINFSGNGTAKYIDLITERVIIAGLPFHANPSIKNSHLWQNSTVRGYLNGINVDHITYNGNLSRTAAKGGDFTHCSNFLLYAFGLSQDNINRINRGEIVEEKNSVEDIEESRTKIKHENRVDGTINSYGIKVQSKPMSVGEQIKFYIDHGKSFMLHGPSGVGKTGRIEELDFEYVSIILRNGILPEEVIGKTIFPSGDKSESGKWIAPAWYVELCEKCKKEPDKNHVLFIDEITNVRPAEQSLVYDIVLNNQIAPNVGKLPENVVLVSAGNSLEESSSAYNMPEPLFRRFEGHIYLKPNVKEFAEWGEMFVDGYNQKIHPLVLAFLKMNEDCLYSSYDNDNPPDYAIDPRGWEQISNIIYANNGSIRKELIENKLGRVMTERFIEFARTFDKPCKSNFSESDNPEEFSK